MACWCNRISKYVQQNEIQIRFHEIIIYAKHSQKQPQSLSFQKFYTLSLPGKIQEIIIYLPRIYMPWERELGDEGGEGLGVNLNQTRKDWDFDRNPMIRVDEGEDLSRRRDSAASPAARARGQAARASRLERDEWGIWGCNEILPHCPRR